MNYNDVYRRSLEDPDGFWRDAASALSWNKPFEKVIDTSKSPFNVWFPGGELNTCFNALDRHVQNGRTDQTALIYDSPVTGTIRHFSYGETLERVSRLAGGLRARGVSKGDRVVIYMPAIPEAVFAMLACARIGAVHSVVFGGFAAHELASRINDAKPVAVLSASCGIETSRVIPYKPMIDAAIDAALFKPNFVAVFQRPQAQAALLPGRDIDWSELDAEPVDCVSLASNDPLYILCTSGTTGAPKGVVRDNAGHAVVLSWTMSNLYATNPGEVYWAASDIGWQVGHSYITYGPMLHGATAVLFEGKPVGTPDAGTFWRVIAEHHVKVLFTAPTAIRAIRREDPDGLMLRRYDLSGLRALFLAGERTDPETLHWAERHLGVPVIDHWWQTETGWPIAGNPLGLERLPVKPGSTSVPMPGWDVRCLDENHNEVARGETGSIVLKLPMAPGALTTLWNADQRFIDSYMIEHPGYYNTGDAGYVDVDGYVFILNRTDDVINVAGHRLSAGALEEALSAHPDVAECVVVGVADSLKGQVPLGLLVLKSGVSRPHDEIAAEAGALVRERIGAIATCKRVIVVQRLPKTRSGKFLRATIRSIADGVEWKMPATIEDPEVLDGIAVALEEFR